AVGVDPEARWPEVASLFREKADKAGRIERLLAWGFDPEVSLKKSRKTASKSSAQAEAYRLQMHELFAKASQLEAYRLQMSELFAKISELERLLSDQAATHQAELANSNLQHQIEVEQLSEQLSNRTLEVARLERQLKAESKQLSEYKSQIARQEQHYTAEVQRLHDALDRQLSQHRIEVEQ